MVELVELYPNPANPGQYKCNQAEFESQLGIPDGEGGYASVSGHRGEGQWIPMMLKHSESVQNLQYETIRIQASWRSSERQACLHNMGQVGIWLPVNDLGTNHDGKGEVHKIDVIRGNYNAKILQHSWDAGKRATVDITSADSRFEGIPVHMYCVPVWNFDSNGCDQSELIVETFGQISGSPRFDLLSQKTFTFSKAQSAQNDADYIFTILKELKALSNQGDGNSVHPKQLITIKQLQTCIEQVRKSGKSDIKIAYIGSDTTENIRSVLRFLDTNEEGEHVSDLQVYMTPDWDRERLEKLGPNFSLDLCTFRGKNITCHILPKVGEMPHIDEEVDIVIATYVTPWATMNFNAGNQYQKLLDSLLGVHSILITTDPQNSTKSVRSRLGEAYNCNSLLTGFGLRPDDNMITPHPMVSSKLWRRAHE